VSPGANTRELMQRIGHASPAAALRYQQVMDGRDAAVASALDDMIEAARRAFWHANDTTAHEAAPPGGGVNWPRAPELG
jgi:hypothetical protein